MLPAPNLACRSEEGAEDAREGVLQVDMDAMAAVVDSLLRYLQLHDSAYNIIFLNPKRSGPHKRYGYRSVPVRPFLSHALLGMPRGQTLIPEP